MEEFQTTDRPQQLGYSPDLIALEELFQDGGAGILSEVLRVVECSCSSNVQSGETIPSCQAGHTHSSVDHKAEDLRMSYSVTVDSDSSDDVVGKVSTDLPRTLLPVRTRVSFGEMPSHDAAQSRSLDTAATASVQNSLSFKRACTFAQNEERLLRGSSLPTILRGSARILQNSKGSALTYDLSQETDHLDFFISHNWNVHRLRKYVALALHFNMVSAVAVAVFVGGLCFALQLAGALPLKNSSVGEVGGNGEPRQVGMFAKLVVTPVFLLTLFFRHDLFPCTYSHQRIFLDKTCIHQTDSDLQQQGIMKLGAFLGNCSRMLVLYSDSYLKKLWTIYEVACFLAVNGTPASIEVVHVSLGPVLLGCVVIMYFMQFVWWIPAVSTTVQYATVYPMQVLAFAFFSRRGHQTLARTFQRLAIFKVEDAICFDESDRPMVEANIQAFMKCQRYVDTASSKEEALHIFNQLVRQCVRRAMKASLGSSPIPFSQIALLLLLTNFPTALDTFTGRLKEHQSAYTLAGYVTMSLSLNFALFPLLAEALSWMMRRFLHLSGWKEGLWICFCSLIMFTVAITIGLITPLALASIEPMSLGFALAMAYESLFWVAAFAFCFRRWYRKRSYRNKMITISRGSRVLKINHVSSMNSNSSL